MTLAQGRLGILLTQDLIFSIKVTGTARALNLRVIAVGEVERAEALCREQRPGCVLIDLGVPGLDLSEIVPRLKAVADGAVFIAFGPHVGRGLLDSAAAAGCHEVYPRSRFSGQLPGLLHRHLAGIGE